MQKAFLMEDYLDTDYNLGMRLCKGNKGFDVRDILTIIGGILIVILTALLVVPHFMDWEARRGMVEQALAEATGARIQTGGKLRIQLLPAPKIYMDQLRINYDHLQGKNISLALDKVETEVALMALLQGKIIFVDAQVGRLELRVPFFQENGFALSGTYPDQIKLMGAWAFANISARQFFLTLENITHNSIEQLSAQNVSMKASKITGPWSVQGQTSEGSFHFTTGDMTPAGSFPVRFMSLLPSQLSSQAQRIEIDGNLHFQNIDNTLGQNLLSVVSSGTLRIQSRAQKGEKSQDGFEALFETSFESEQASFLFKDTQIELMGHDPIQLNGSGQYRAFDNILLLDLKNRGMSVERNKSGNEKPLEFYQDIVQQLGDQLIGVMPSWVGLMQVTIQSDYLALGEEQLSQIVFKGQWKERIFSEGALHVAGSDFTKLGLSMELGRAGWFGRLEVTSADTQKLGKIITEIAGDNNLSKLLNGLSEPSFGLMTNFGCFENAVSLSDLRVVTGNGILSGMAGLTRIKESRPLLKAQLVARNFAPARFTSTLEALSLLKSIDSDVTLEARDFVDGKTPIKGRIFAHLVSNAQELKVNSFNVDHLLGTNISLKSAIAKDKTEVWEGSITTDRLSSVLELFQIPWTRDLSRLLPSHLLELPMQVEISTQSNPRSPQGGSQSVINIQGTLAGGAIKSQIHVADGLIQNWTLDAKTHMLSSLSVGFKAFPFQIEAKGQRDGTDIFALTGNITSENMAFQTNQAMLYNTATSSFVAGKGTLVSDDLRSFLDKFGISLTMPKPVPATLQFTLPQENIEAVRLMVSGHVGSEEIQGHFSKIDPKEIIGALTLKTFSLPWVLDRFVLASQESGVFAAKPNLPMTLKLAVTAEKFELLTGYLLEKSHLNMCLDDRGIHILSLKGELLSGVLSASGSVTRDGGLAAVAGELTWDHFNPSSFSAQPSRFEGDVSVTVQFGAAAERAEGLIANLGGAGSVNIHRLLIHNLSDTVFQKIFDKKHEFSEFLSEEKLIRFIQSELVKGSFETAKTDTTTSFILSGGTFQTSEFVLEGGKTSLRTSMMFDLKTMVFSGVNSLMAHAYPEEWQQIKPEIKLFWKSLLKSAPLQIDVTLLRNALAEIVLNRETERIRALEKHSVQ